MKGPALKQAKNREEESTMISKMFRIALTRSSGRNQPKS